MHKRTNLCDYVTIIQDLCTSPITKTFSELFNCTHASLADRLIAKCRNFGNNALSIAAAFEHTKTTSVLFMSVH